MNDEIMKQLGFGKEVKMKNAGKCPFCGKDVDDKEFRDDLSRREFKISGLCQECQDKMFKEN